MKAILTDIDDTLVDRAGDPELAQCTQKIVDYARDNKWLLVTITGADLPFVQRRMDTGEVPAADHIICAVGTEVWQRQGNAYVQDADYEKRIKATGYSRVKVAKQADDVITEYAKAKPNMELQVQAKTPEEPYKVSLHFFGTDDDATWLHKDFEKRFPNYKIVTCQEINYNATLPPGATRLKHCADVVPATKSDALAYIIERLGITGGVKAGDSGNDTDMLLHSDPLLGVLVGGAKTEAQNAIKARIPTLKTGPIQTLDDGREFYLEDQSRRGPQSLLNALGLVDR